MLILLDLDGTITNTIHPDWKPYRDGLEEYPVDNIPIFTGAVDFIRSREAKGDKLLVVSDSHTRYVEPICNRLGLSSISLADKPNTYKIKQIIGNYPTHKELFDRGNCIMIGDTKLDIEFGRRLNIPTIWFLPYIICEEIKNERDGIGDEMASKKMGPTYFAKTFADIENILDNPFENLYSIESSFLGKSSNKSIKYSFSRYKDGSYACIRCLARQEQGSCDEFARADKYFTISNPQRTPEFLHTLANSVSAYICQNAVMNENWDYFTYLSDKGSTIPKDKMKEIFDLVDTRITKVQLFRWSENVEGSLRNRNLYRERREFLEHYLQIQTSEDMNLQGKNIIILDDQLTTGATAWFVIQKLKGLGVKNVLFIAMFQMLLSVDSEMICPQCGKPMLLKIRRTDGHRFYSCTPPQYRGDGCGYTIDIDEINQNV